METSIAPSQPLICIRSSASLQETAQRMCDMSIGALGVRSDDHEFVGLVTERDILFAIAQDKDPRSAELSEIVNDFPLVVDGPVEADTAVATMAAAHVRHLLIRSGDALRIVSLRDLVGRGAQARTKAISGARQPSC